MPATDEECPVLGNDQPDQKVSQHANKKHGLFMVLMTTSACAMLWTIVSLTMFGARMAKENTANVIRIKEALIRGRVVKDVIDGIQGPPMDLKVKYGGFRVRNGQLLSQLQTSSMPEVEIAGINDQDLYTLVMVDPDAPSPENPTEKEWLHWLIVDIPGASSISAAGKVVVEYNEPTPPSGTHRYVFLLYFQNGPSEVTPPNSRAKFNSREFAKKFGLGNPVAALFFRVEPEWMNFARG